MTLILFLFSRRRSVAISSSPGGIGLWIAIFLISILFQFSGALFAQQGGLDAAEPIGPYLDGVLPDESNGAGDWELVSAFPNLAFNNPVGLIPVPGGNQLLVIEKPGRLAVFENNPSTIALTELLDISPQVEGASDSGMLGVAFHPEFGQAGSPNRDYLYVYYRFTPDKSVGIHMAYCRLSRFTWPEGTTSIDPASEFVLINQYDRHNWHNGGGIFFGSDGFLYLSIGDEGGSLDQFGSGQIRNVGLLSGVLRIDVDMDTTRSHPIRRQPLNPTPPPPGWPDSSSQGYYIPNDNPWLSPGGSELEEFYAIGLRSPHRMTYDAASGQIFLGDVGQGSMEEINLIVKGGNYQWPYLEGTNPGFAPKPNPLTGTDEPPLYPYGRADGGCVIGGYVYRGSRHPDLVGKYMFGDYNNGVIRILTQSPGGPPLVEDLVSLPPQNGSTNHRLSSFGVDAAGEIYAIVLNRNGGDGEILRFDRGLGGGTEPPALLSQTGAFVDLANLTPRPGVMPYDLVQPLWSDGAEKKRWISIPNDGTPDSPEEQIGFSENGPWTFPAGTVLIKHFEIGSRRLETRFLVRSSSGSFHGYTYKWRPDNSEADLLPGPPLEETIGIGGGQNVTWHFPGRTECIVCHTPSSGMVLGPKTRHLNRDFFYPATGRTANQLLTLDRLGFFSPPLDESAIPGFLTAANIADPGATLEHRTRSYIDINCSQCHLPGGPTQAQFDARLTTPLMSQNLVNAMPINNLGNPDAKIVKPGDVPNSILHSRMNSLDGCCAMPPLAKNVIDAAAVQVVAEWIGSLETESSPGLLYEYYNREFVDVPDFSAFTPDKTGVVTHLDLTPRAREDAYAFRFHGFINLPASGDYTFHLNSDDGSELHIGGVLAIDNGGLHGPETISATLNLAAGAHAFEVGFIEFYGEAVLELEIEGPGLPRQPVPASFFTQTGGDGTPPPNRPPVLGPVAPQIAETGESISLTLTASDADGDTLTFSASGLPSGLSLDPATGIVSGIPTTAGVSTVIYSVADGNGGSDSGSFSWTISDPNTGGPAPGLIYEYYNREFEEIPDFSTLTPDKTGVVANLDLSPRTRDDAYVFRFLGNLNITTPGNYTFYLTSDDGSTFRVDGALAIDNDGLHGPETVASTLNLSAGSHPIEVAFLEYYGEAVLMLEIAGPGLSRQLVSNSMLTQPGGGGGPINQPPSFPNLSDFSSLTGDSVSITATATDPDGDVLTYSATGLPPGAALNSTTGIISGTVTSPGIFNVALVVADGEGGTDSENFTWTVTEPNPDGSLPGLRYDYYEGEYEQLPNFSSLTPVKSGVVNGFDLSPRLSEDTYVFRYYGEINLPAAGDYTFYLASDDGSKLWIDGALIVDNDGLHGLFEKSATVNLTAGSHQIEVAFFEWYGGAELNVEIAGPGLSRQGIPGSLLTHAPPPGGSGSGNSGSGYDLASDDSASASNRLQPDNWIGLRLGRQVGNNVYNSNGASQKVRLVFKNSRSRKLFVTAQNDRLVPDLLKVKATRERRVFKITWFQRNGAGRGNVTAQVTSGSGLQLPEMSAADRIQFSAKVTPRPRRRGTRRIYINSSSGFPGIGIDRVLGIMKIRK